MTEMWYENVALFDGERVDNTGFGQLRLIQKPEEFCYGVDAVLLADFAAKHGKKPASLSVDLGTGTGIVPLILSYKTKIGRLIGVEVQEGSYDRAVRNARLNGLTGRMELIHGDVADYHQGWAKDRALAGKADWVTCNPPYTAGNCGLVCSNRAKHIARHETTADLETFIRCSAYILRDKGELFLVHRPSRIVDLCCFGRKYGLEVKTLQFVSPNSKAVANILLVQMVKGGGREARLLEPLCVYDGQGNYTEALRQAYV